MSDLNRTDSGLDPSRKLKLLSDLRELLAQLWKRIGVKTEDDWEAALTPHQNRITAIAQELGLCGQHQFDFPPVGVETVEGPDFGQMKITYLKYKDPLSGNSSKQLIRAFERSPEFPNERVWNMKINQGREVRDWCLVLLESWDSYLSSQIRDLQAKEPLASSVSQNNGSTAPEINHALGMEIKGDTTGLAVLESRLKPSLLKAYLAFEHAEQANECQMKIKDAWNYLNENGIEGHAQLEDYQLPDFPTFSTYVSRSRGIIGKRRNRPRGNRTSRSVVHISEV